MTQSALTLDTPSTAVSTGIPGATGSPADVAKLAAKVAAIMEAVDRVAKRGRNDFHKYDYATEADIAAKVRKEFASRQVVLFPQVDKWTLVELPPGKENKQRDPLMVLDMSFLFVDGETGASLTRTWLGVGQDAGDKGAYKALTGGEKYWLLKVLMIPTGDDPERDSGTKTGTAKADRATKKARPELPRDSGAVYIEQVVPKQSGNRRWVEVVVSTGESFPVQEHKHELVALCTELAQGTQAVVLETHVNAKQKKELDMVRRWPLAAEDNDAPGAAPVAQPQAPVAISADDVKF